MHALWFEGTDHGLVWSHGMALVSGEVSTKAAGDIWLEFVDGGDLAAFLKLLSIHTGTDVLSLPGFAIALRTPRGDWQLAARGDWVAQVDDEVVQGAGISTWAERSVTGGAAACVGRVGDPAEGRPLVAGLAVAGGLAWGSAVPTRRTAPAHAAQAEVRHGAQRRPQPPAAPVEPAAPVAVPLVSAETDPDLPVLLPPAGPADGVQQDEGVELPDWAATLLGEEADLAPEGDEAEPDEPNLPQPEPPTGDQAEPEDAPVEAPAPHDDSADDRHTLDPAAEAPAGTPAEASAWSGRFARQYGDTEMFSIEDAAVRTDQDGEFIAGVPGAAPAAPTPPPQPDAGSSVPPQATPPVAAVAEDRTPGEGHTTTTGGMLRLHDAEGDHDGETVLAADFESGATSPEPGPEPIAPGEWSVLGVRCPQGHPNPPHRSTCFECGAPLTGAAHRMPRPALGRLKLPSGEIIDLTVPVIVGRNPRVERYQGTVLPRLVPLSQGHVSSNHLELRLEEWNVLAVDLHSTNGTFLRRRGEAPVRLGERPELLMDGDVLDLGHGVQLTLEGLR